jgi:hypothetical protein
MGFMDKAKQQAKQLGDQAKQLGEQAQQKIDEVQKDFNKGGEQPQQGQPAVRYDEHGRPIEEGPPAGEAPPPPAEPAPAPPDPGAQSPEPPPPPPPPPSEGGADTNPDPFKPIE